MICTWTVSVLSGITNFAICGSDNMQCRSTFSTEAHSLILYIDSSISFGFTNFVEVMICIIFYTTLQNTIFVITSIILLKLMVFFKGCDLLKMVSYHKQVAVVAESIRCLDQQTEQYEVCFPEFNLKYICIYLYLCYN